MSWLARILGRSESKQSVALDHTNAACSFCGKPRQDVYKMVHGAKVYICDGCVALTVQILDEEMRADQKRSFHVDLILGGLAHDGPRVPHARATPALRAAIELASGDPNVLRHICEVASGVSDFATAREALATIPADERRNDDRLNIATLFTDVGRSSDALVALDAIDDTTLVDVDRVWFRLTRAQAELELGAIARPRIAVHRATAIELAPVVAAFPVGGVEEALRIVRLAVLTLAALGLGELDEAEQAARDRLQLSPSNPYAHEALARVLAARGDPTGSDAARAQAREHAHPDSIIARRLRDGAPFRS